MLKVKLVIEARKEIAVHLVSRDGVEHLDSQVVLVDLDLMVLQDNVELK